MEDYNDESQPRTLYVGNLDSMVTENLIIALFGQIGEVKGCKIIHEPNNDPYCFVEFAEHSAAAAGLNAMNKRVCLGKELKVNWATSPSNAPKQDTSKHYHVFVGDLSHDVQTHQLQAAFAPFGEISDCKIIRDPQTLKSKGYGFVSFVRKVDAENAIKGMNGQWIGSRPIRTNWATRKPPAPPQKEGRTPHPMSAVQKLSYDEVYNQSSPTNCTVYCGGINNGLSQELVQQHFIQFGQIEEIRIFKDKGYAFIRYNNKEAATNAIVSVHGTDVNGCQVKCSWGKESNEGPNPAASQQYANAPAGGPGGQGFGNYYNQMGYYMGYPQQYSQMPGNYMQNAQYGYGMQGCVQGSYGQMPMGGAPGGQQYNGQQQMMGMGGYPMQQGYQTGYQQAQ
ncbi:nucleolysin TIAR isoform X3 [Lingula anatina]|uniref:Nucleolysin TIAR isoform X3 n=1 Tax=Lingula anatina TaxID=7574 RepID=A0A1S3H7A7_LINAN|nr:nucleolysin TIAR isoform X3 [Lingula anatina]|eukprot:XP_013381004.1 nucleolysin TIAR isoform X3 [Lingula anatina]